jgi:hypothetical protein
MTRYYHSLQHICRFDSVSTHFNKIFRLTLLALAVLFVSSCEEGPTKIGEGILPGSDFVTLNSTDTLGVNSYTLYNKSVRTDNLGTSYLGQIYDPYFGTTTAGFVTQIRMSAAWDDLPFTIDSVKLVLAFLDVKGGSDVVHTLKLSEIAQQIYTDSAYYSDTQVPLTGFEIADIRLPVLKPDSINYVEINLDTLFGKYLTRDTAKLFYSNTKQDFRSFFKGLYFQMDPSTDPLLVSLSLVASSTASGYNNQIVLFMHDNDGVAKEFFFVLDAINKNASFSLFSHDFSTATLGQNIQNIINKESTPAASDTLSYLQALDGVYTKIVMPGLEGIKNNPSLKNIAVNKAHLTVPLFLDGNLYKTSTIPSQLFLRYNSLSGTELVVPDYSINASFFDGTVDSIANVYNFNIPAFVQAYLNDATNTIKPELEIFQATGSKNVILKANSCKTPVKFEFTYTKF